MQGLVLGCESLAQARNKGPHTIQAEKDLGDHPPSALTFQMGGERDAGMLKAG